MNTAIKGDAALMDEFITQGTTDSQMRDINRCRIYLQICYTSYIMDLAGNAIEEWAKQGERKANRMSKRNWHVQQRPPAGAWRNWTLALQGIASVDGDLDNSLGPWRVKVNTHQSTEWDYKLREAQVRNHGSCIRRTSVYYAQG
jgi:hypothetical protein